MLKHLLESLYYIFDKNIKELLLKINNKYNLMNMKFLLKQKKSFFISFFFNYINIFFTFYFDYIYNYFGKNFGNNNEITFLYEYK